MSPHLHACLLHTDRCGGCPGSAYCVGEVGHTTLRIHGLNSVLKHTLTHAVAFPLLDALCLVQCVSLRVSELL